VPIILKFILFQLLIIVPFIGGTLARRYFTDPAAVAKKIIGLNLVALEPPVILWTIWGLGISPGMAILPAAGLVIVLAGFAAGSLMAPMLRLQDASRKTFLISSSLANHGFTMGGFICYVLMGETGLGLSSIFLIYFVPYTFLIIFSYARAGKTFRAGIGEFLIGFRNMPLYASLAALALLASGIPRPALRPPVEPLIMASVALYYWTLGLTTAVKKIAPLRREHLALGTIKFILIPALTWLVLIALPIDSDLKSVIRIQSFMPAAIYSVVTSVLFDLDSPLASSLFVVNTMIFIIIMVPVIALLRQAGLW
jgi:malate permease and related proteins